MMLTLSRIPLGCSGGKFFIFKLKTFNQFGLCFICDLRQTPGGIKVTKWAFFDTPRIFFIWAFQILSGTNPDRRRLI